MVFVVAFIEMVLAAGNIPVSPVASVGAGDKVAEWMKVATTKVSRPTAIGVIVVSGEKDSIEEKRTF